MASTQQFRTAVPDIFTTVTESYPLEEITHYSRIPSENNNHIVADPHLRRTSSEDYYSSEPLSVGTGTTIPVHPSTSKNTVNSYVENSGNTFPSPTSTSSASDDDGDEITQYNRYDKKIHKKGFKNSTGIGSGNSSNLRSAISDDNFPTILNSNAIVTKADVIFALLILLITTMSFTTDLILVIWHYNNGFTWYSVSTATIMVIGASSLLHQFSLADIDRLKRMFDHAKRARILTNCIPTCGTMISSTFLVSTSVKAVSNQMYALQYFSLEEFVQNLLRVQSLFQAAPQAILQLLIFLETLDEISTFKDIFLLVNVVTSLTIMTIGNIPSRASEFDNKGVNPSSYSNPVTRLFIGVRMFSCFASRIMSIVYMMLGFNCILGKLSSYSTAESFLISLCIILTPRLIFTCVDVMYRRYRRQKGHTITNLSCCRIFLGYLATIFFPMSDPLWIFWFIWFETIIFLLFGNIVGWSNSTNCIHNLVNSIYTGIFIVVFIIIPIFLPFARAKAKKRLLKRMENIFESRANQTSGPSSASTPTTMATSSFTNNTVIRL